jgi:hypothetical protein
MLNRIIFGVHIFVQEFLFFCNVIKAVIKCLFVCLIQVKIRVLFVVLARIQPFRRIHQLKLFHLRNYFEVYVTLHFLFPLKTVRMRQTESLHLLFI